MAPSPTSPALPYIWDHCARDTPESFAIFNCGFLEVVPRTDRPADWVVRRFDPDCENDSIDVYFELEPFREHSHIASHPLAGDLSILSFDRYKTLFHLHLRLAARPKAGRPFVAWLGCKLTNISTILLNRHLYRLTAACFYTV